VEQERLVDHKTGRKCYLHLPSDLSDGKVVTFILNLHGGGSVGAWQSEYFSAYDYADAYRLVIATPSAATKEPFRHWVAAADDEYLADLAEAVIERFGARNIRSFWLVGHSQGGITSNRLLSTNQYFANRVDGWLSLSGGRLGLSAERTANAGPPRSEAERARMDEVFASRRIFDPPPPPTADFSFIYATGEHEIASLPETSPWADRYGAKARVGIADVVDTQPGKIHDGRFDQNPTKSWGRQPAPGTAQVYVFPDARDGRVIADVVRMDKGHTEGLEPRITEEIIKLMVSAPGGKLQTGGTRLGADSAPG
jgi:pimeloyl-ACP methyl ester carboxylesterase